MLLRSPAPYCLCFNVYLERVYVCLFGFLLECLHEGLHLRKIIHSMLIFISTSIAYTSHEYAMMQLWRVWSIAQFICVKKTSGFRLLILRLHVLIVKPGVHKRIPRNCHWKSEGLGRFSSTYFFSFRSHAEDTKSEFMPGVNYFVLRYQI